MSVTIDTETRIREDRERKEKQSHIRRLIRDYESVRGTPGPVRDGALRRLDMALAKHWHGDGGPVLCDGYLYRWSRESDSVFRMPARRPGEKAHSDRPAGIPTRTERPLNCLRGRQGGRSNR
jgi:hypothetical protein